MTIFFLYLKRVGSVHTCRTITQCALYRVPEDSICHAIVAGSCSIIMFYSGTRQSDPPCFDNTLPNFFDLPVGHSYRFTAGMNQTLLLRRVTYYCVLWGTAKFDPLKRSIIYIYYVP